MKYRYFYQTKENENRDGWVTARDRADAYATLRKQGIRPYRVVGDDPVRWQPWAIGGLFVVLTILAVTFATLLFSAEAPKVERPPVRRCQLSGDAGILSRGLLDNWRSVFPSHLDRYLAAYAQPGWLAMPEPLSEEELAAVADELKRPACEPASSDSAEVRQIKEIVALMRAELREHLDRGGTVAEYLSFLETRQNDEIEFRRMVVDWLQRTPESLRDHRRVDLNGRLRLMGLPEIKE